MTERGYYMWYKSESKDIPTEIDMTSSQVYVYVRKNIIPIQREDETLYEYDEIKIPKEAYEIFKLETENTDRIADLEDVLADMLFGGDE